MASTISYDNKVDLSTSPVADINKVTASDLNQIKTIVNNNALEQNSLATRVPVISSDYIKIGSIGICWGQAHPTYANANVLLANNVSLPLSFTDGRCIASTVNYNNQAVELDAIAKVPNTVNGNTMSLAMHSAGAKFTSSSTSFYINYVVIGQVS
jgi:hypothetical protein